MTMIHSQLLPILVLLLAAAADLLLLQGAAAAAMARDGCIDKCGDITIPFPFGMNKPECFLPGFEVTCDSSSRAFLAYKDGGKGTHHDLSDNTFSSVDGRPTGAKTAILSQKLLPVELIDISLSKSEIRAYGAVRFDCSTSATDHRLRLESTTLEEPFLLAATRNVLVGIGGSFKAELGDSLASCSSKLTSMQLATNGSCAGQGCCQAALPLVPAISKFRVAYKLENNPSWKTTPCNYGMLVEAAWYNFSTLDLYGADEVLSKKNPRGVPFVIDFAIRGGGSCPAEGQKPPPDYACVSGNSSCANAAVGGGYVCKCRDNYDGNPYIPNGCQVSGTNNLHEDSNPADSEAVDVDECELRKQSPELASMYPCSSDGICKNKIGGYDCPCKPGMRGDGKAGTCVEKFPLAAKIVVGIVAVLSAVVVALLSAVTTFQKRQLFRKNGGKKLANVESIMLFTKSELKEITGNYANLLGKGLFGEVYEGTLADKDKTKVAVKTSVVVDKANVDEFTREVEIQSKMIHKNVLKLKGCCLEVKRPMLVYEFAANGSLEGIVHGKENAPLPLERRLDIAIGSAQGLAYMHTHRGSNIIQHGDVKPGNILLDDEFVPKIDFGLSKLIGLGNQYAELVKGSKGYMDPVYHLTRHLTPASDVYSFGVVLLELIARKPIVYDEDCNLIMTFQRVYEQQNSGRKMFDQEIAKTQEDFAVLEGIGRLAIQCLAREVKDRPDMTKVATQLAMLKEEWKRGKTNLAGGDNN